VDVPDRYLGDQRFSYGLALTFSLRVGEEGARGSVEDIIIEGDGRRISAPIFAQQNDVSIIVVVSFVSGSNRVDAVR